MDYWTKSTAEQAPAFAEAAVKTLRSSGTHLDYSPESIFRIEEVIDMLRLGGHTPDSVGDTVFALGCYAGEILVRHGVGVWKKADAVALTMADPLFIELRADGGVCNVISKVFKRLINGEEDSVAQFVLFFLQKYAVKQKGKLDWQYATLNNHYFMFADADNGMKAVISSDNEGFAFPIAMVDYGQLSKMPNSIIVDQRSAMDWCEEEIAQWQPIPKL